MSAVTNLILTFSISENEKSIEEEITKYINNGNPFTIASIDSESLPKGWYGGAKYFETNVYLGAYNNLKLNDFISHLERIKWSEKEGVRLIVKEEDDLSFRMISLAGDKA